MFASEWFFARFLLLRATGCFYHVIWSEQRQRCQIATAQSALWSLLYCPFFLFRPVETGEANQNRIAIVVLREKYCVVEREIPQKFMLKLCLCWRVRRRDSIHSVCCLRVLWMSTRRLYRNLRDFFSTRLTKRNKNRNECFRVKDGIDYNWQKKLQFSFNASE